MRPKNAKPVRAHGLPKSHKNFLNIPKFSPALDTTGTSHGLVGKLLYPLTTNEFSLKDSFDVANRIKAYYHIFSKMVTNTYLLMWNHYSPILS